MDTSQKYIEMCKDAQEIQARWSVYTGKVGDVYAGLHPGCDEWKISILTRPESDVVCVWLPRQDQLQQLNKVSGFHSLSQVVAQIESIQEHVRYWCKFFSQEQFWLAWLMYSEYGKVWDGSEWHIAPKNDWGVCGGEK